MFEPGELFRRLQKDDLVAHHERGEHRLDFVSDCLALVLRHPRDRDRGDAAVAAMWPHLNGTVDSSFTKGRENAREYSFGGMPPKKRLEHLADTGKGHRINGNDLRGNSGTLGRTLTYPRFQFTRLDCRARLQLHVADGQLASIGVRLTDHGGKAYGRMPEHDFFYRAGIDVVAATNNKILGAAGDPEVAVLVDAAKIPGIDPIPINECALVVSLVKITAEDARSCHDDNPDLVGLAVTLDSIVAVQLDDAHTAIGHRMADRSQPDGTIRVSQGVDARGLGHAVDLNDRNLEPFLDRFADGHGNGGSPTGCIA